MVSVRLPDNSTRSVLTIQSSEARFHFSIMLLTCFIRNDPYGYETQRLTFFFTFFFFLSIFPSFLISLYIFYYVFSCSFCFYLFFLTFFHEYLCRHIYKRINKKVKFSHNRPVQARAVLGS